MGVTSVRRSVHSIFGLRRRLRSLPTVRGVRGSGRKGCSPSQASPMHWCRPEHLRRAFTPGRTGRFSRTSWTWARQSGRRSLEGRQFAAPAVRDFAGMLLWPWETGEWTARCRRYRARFRILIPWFAATSPGRWVRSAPRKRLTRSEAQWPWKEDAEARREFDAAIEHLRGSKRKSR